MATVETKTEATSDWLSLRRRIAGHRDPHSQALHVLAQGRVSGLRRPLSGGRLDGDRDAASGSVVGVDGPGGVSCCRCSHRYAFQF